MSLADISYALRQSEEWFGRMVGQPDDSPIMGLFKQIPSRKPGGRGLRHYFNQRIVGRSGFGIVSEGGNYPSPGQETQKQCYVDVSLLVASVEVNRHELQALASREKLTEEESVMEQLEDAAKKEKFRIGRILMMRNDMVVGRADGSGSSASVIYSSIPVNCIAGDKIRAFRDRGYTNDASWGTDSVQVVVPDLNPGSDVASANTVGKIVLAANASWQDDSVLVLDGVTSPSSALPMGLQAHVDSVNVSGFKYDADDSTTYDHVDTYCGLSRATNSWLNAGVTDAGGSLTLEVVSQAALSVLTRGAKPSDLVLIMHPLDFINFCGTYSSLQQGTVYEKIHLPGGSYDLPMLNGLGVTRMPVITDPGWVKGKPIIVDKSVFRSILELSGWVPGSKNSYLHLTPASSGGGYAAKYQAYYEYWFQTFCVAPCRTQIIMNIG